jgi:alpha-beta hydrolase superfamily lysophospholipase
MATASTSQFQLDGADGKPLRGEVRTAAGGVDRPAIVICHGFKGFKDWGFFPHLATRVARAGMTAVTFNFSGSGVGPDGESFSEPERFGHATISNDLVDLQAVADALREGRLAPGLAVPTRLGLFGHSRGGSIALLYGAKSRTAAALVTWSAVADLMRWDRETVDEWRARGQVEIVNARTGDVLPLYTDYLDDLERHRHGAFDLLGAAGRLAIPWLVVHGDADEAVAVGDGERLFGAASHGTTRLERIPGGTHTLGACHPWAGSTPQLEAAMGLTIEWFSNYLL